MEFSTVWEELRERSEAIDPDEVLVTPSSERAFTVDRSQDDRIVIEYVEDGEKRPLWRTQFEVLCDRIETGPDRMSISDLPAGVEPYVSVVSLSSRYAVDESAGTLARSGSSEGVESPFVRPEWTVRTRPERVHDDTVLLADLLDRYDVDDPESLSPEVLVDLYVLLSDVQHGANDFRKEVGDLLLEYIGPDANRHGRFGTVRRTTRDRRQLRDERTVLDALDEEGIPHEWVLGVDREKLDVVLAVTELDESAVYDTEQQVYVQKTTVDEEEKQSRLQGLRDRLAALDTGDAEELREDIQELEERLDTMLPAD